MHYPNNSRHPSEDIPEQLDAPPGIWDNPGTTLPPPPSTSLADSTQWQSVLTSEIDNATLPPMLEPPRPSKKAVDLNDNISTIVFRESKRQFEEDVDNSL